MNEARRAPKAKRQTDDLQTDFPSLDVASANDGGTENTAVASGADAINAEERVKVWDVATRLFHWALVCLVITSWITGSIGFMTVHLWSGTAVLGLLMFRLAWGVVGSTSARFDDFVTGPRAVIRYFKALRQDHGGGDRFAQVGHNPAGGWMVIALLAVLAAQVTTGLFSNNAVRFSGPLAQLVSRDQSDQITEWHGLTFNLLLLLIWCHLVAVCFYLFVKGDDLISPMITGCKRGYRVPPQVRLRFTRPFVAWMLLAGSMALALWIA